MKSKKMKALLTFILKFVSLISKLIPKSAKKVLFYTNLGFRDNVKAFYDYLVENNYNEKYKIYCSCDEYREVDKCKRPPNVKFISKVHGVATFLTSKYVFYCFGKFPIVPTKDQVVVNFWHGMPLKTIGNLETPNCVKNKYFTYILATSDMFANLMKTALNCDKAIICGQPRNDKLFLAQNDNLYSNRNKVIVWMPTFRKSDRLNYIDSENGNWLPIFNDIEKLNEVNSMLKADNSLLIIKLHPLQNAINTDKEHFSNIVIKEHNDFVEMGVDLYSLLGRSDALITDYSSVYFDYLLLDRPIAFTIDDMSSYGSKRGFVFENPMEMMPGAKVKSPQDFIAFINNVLINNDTFKEDRREINDVCNKYKDGEFCQKIAQEIGLV